MPIRRIRFPPPLVDRAAPMVRFAASIWFLAFAAPGCVRHDGEAPPSSPPLAFGWVSPAAGDSVAGMVSLEVDVRGQGIDRVIFLAGGIPVDTANAAPWAGRWHCQGFAAPTRIVLQAVVQREDGSGATGGEVLVWAVPNEPPSLTLRRPRPTTWIERSAGVALEAEAVDPEDGPVPAGQVRWTGPGLERGVTGMVLPVEILREEVLQIVVEAADRWNECARETLVIRPFRYLPADTPSACADNVAAAIRAMDTAGLGAMLADSFLFVPCSSEAASAGWPAVWPQDRFVELARAWLSAPSTSQVEFIWRLVHADSWRAGTGEKAWAELADTSIRFRPVLASPGGPADSVGVEICAAFGSVMQLALRRSPGAPWRITAWRELATGEGRSLAGLLAAESSWPSPRPGAGCTARRAGGRWRAAACLSEL